MLSALFEKSADLAARDSVGRTVMFWAAMSGRPNIIQFLLEQDCSSELADVEGSTPLSTAAEYGHEAVVKLLLQSSNQTLDTPDQDGGTPLSWAAWNGHLDVVSLLLEKGAEVDRQDVKWGRTAVSWAAESGHWDIVNLLIHKHGADPDSISNDTHRSPLSYAAEKGHLLTVTGLLETNRVDACNSDNEGKTALDHARLSRRKRVISVVQKHHKQNPGS